MKSGVTYIIVVVILALFAVAPCSSSGSPDLSVCNGKMNVVVGDASDSEDSDDGTDSERRETRYAERLDAGDRVIYYS